MSDYFNAEIVADIIPSAYVNSLSTGQTPGQAVSGAIAMLNGQPGPDVTIAASNASAANATTIAVGAGSNTITVTLTPNALASVKCNNNGAAAPGVSDDSSAGYAIFSMWIDKSVAAPYDVYLCTAAAVGAAQWAKLT